MTLDRWPANYYEATLPGLHLPRSVCFAKFLLSPNEVLRLHLRDASNYYYLLRVPDARLPFQGIGPPVNVFWWDVGCPDDWQEKDIFNGGALLQPTFRAVLMGDINGVVI
eukprot:780128-Heterocapsa_arctica.AAC.1